MNPFFGLDWPKCDWKIVHFRAGDFYESKKSELNGIGVKITFFFIENLNLYKHLRKHIFSIDGNILNPANRHNDNKNGPKWRNCRTSQV